MCSREAERLFRLALEACDPAERVAAALAEEELADEVVLLALGKAAVPMARGARAALGERVAAEVVVAPALPDDAPPGWMVGAHPRPDARSERAGRALLAAASAARPGQSVLALVSGGGSALAAVPAGGLSLEDKAEALAAVYAAGADIHELNAVRAVLSAIKGGRLAAASRAPVLSLVASDVVGDDLATVASGPTVPGAGDDPAAARRIVEARVGLDAVPEAVRRLLVQPSAPPPARPGDRARLVAGVGAFVDAAAAAAGASGWQVEVASRELEGDVAEVAERFAAAVRQARPGSCVLAGGEATIALGPAPGVGGRAQHLALLLARAFDGDERVELGVLGSDGVDGNSDAAGAIVSGGTWGAIGAAGLDPAQALEGRDAGTALARVGAQVVTGPTGVNHCDLLIALRR